MLRRNRSSIRRASLKASSTELADDHHTHEFLTALWCAGDEGAVDAAWKLFGVAFTRRLAKRFRSLVARDECEEIASAAVERAWENRGRFLPAKGPLEAWLWQITYRLAAATIREPWCKERHRETQLTAETLVATVKLPLAQPEKDGGAESEQNICELVSHAMAALTSFEHAVLRADMLSPDGTAASGALSNELGIPKSTVRSHRSRAKAKLKAELARLGYRPAPRADHGPTFSNFTVDRRS